MGVKVEDFADVLADELQKYSDAVAAEVKDATKQVAKEVKEEIQRNVTFNPRTGKYINAFRVKKMPGETRFRVAYIWYVADPYYRLTHLLEKGHQLKNGGRTKAFPHIKYGDELAKRRMEELVKEAIERAGR